MPNFGFVEGAGRGRCGSATRSGLSGGFINRDALKDDRTGLMRDRSCLYFGNGC